MTPRDMPILETLTSPRRRLQRRRPTDNPVLSGNIGLRSSGVENQTSVTDKTPDRGVNQPVPAVPDRPGSSADDVARLRMLSRIAEQVGEGVVVSDNDGWFQYVNSTFAAQHAGTVAELTGAHMRSFYRPDELAEHVQPVIAAAMSAGIGRGEVVRLRRDGTEFPARITLSLLHDESGTLIGRVLCVQDISNQRALEEELRQAALYDPLTRLPNRRLLRDRVEHALLLRERRPTRVGALFIDLDDFKKINDTLGHEVGDEVLVAVGQRLARIVRSGDTLARYGGDEYVMLLDELRDRHHAMSIGRRVRAGLAHPITTTAGELAVSGSIGIHVASDHDDYHALLTAADRAMYDAKRAGAGRIRLTPPETPGDQTTQTAQGPAPAGEAENTTIVHDEHQGMINPLDQAPKGLRVRSLG
jgi:diguanylate cyclase (GGDEF)-like protein/PAS domain S-box-containing protein